MASELFRTIRFLRLALGLLPFWVGWTAGQDREIPNSAWHQNQLRLWELILMRDARPSDEVPPRQEMVRSYIERGNEWLQKNRVDLAAADFDLAIELDPECAEAYHNRGLARAVSGDARAAIADFSKAIAIRPDLGAAYLGRAVLRLQQGDSDGAIGDLQTLTKVDPKRQAITAAALCSGLLQSGRRS